MSVQEQLTVLIAAAADPESPWFGMSATEALKAAASQLGPESSWTQITAGVRAPEGYLLDVAMQRLHNGVIERCIVRGVTVTHPRYNYQNPVFTRGPLPLHHGIDTVTNTNPHVAIEVNGWYVTDFAIALMQLPPPVAHSEP